MKNDNTYLNVLYDLAVEHKFPHAVILECSSEKICEEAALKIAEISLCTGNTKPCGKCSNCIKMKSGYHPDVSIISPQGTGKSIKIEDIRFIRDDAYIVSNEGGYKFYLIKNAESMTVQAQNAFIKILEEPPEKVIFLLLCASAGALLDTVKSRSQIFKLDENFEESSESITLAKDLVQAAVKKDACEVIRCAAKIPNDRKIFKDVVQCTLSELLSMYSNGDFDSVNSKEFIKNIEEIRCVSQLIDKNVNFNLLVCYFCACLQF